MLVVYLSIWEEEGAGFIACELFYITKQTCQYMTVKLIR